MNVKNMLVILKVIKMIPVLANKQMKQQIVVDIFMVQHVMNFVHMVLK